MFNTMFGNEILIRNIGASSGDFYLNKENYRESTQNQVLN